jgi:hypothetical protein
VQRLTRDSRTLTVAQILKSQCLSILTIESQCVEDFFFRMSATDSRTLTEATILQKEKILGTWTFDSKYTTKALTLRFFCCFSGETVATLSSCDFFFSQWGDCSESELLWLSSPSIAPRKSFTKRPRTTPI